MKEFTLQPFSEFKFETQAEIRIFIITGNAEINGQELLNEKWYVFKNTAASIYSLKGATLKVDGNCTLSYVSSEKNIEAILNVFESLLNEPCNICVIGNERGGISTMLCNFYARTHKRVVLVETDPSTGTLVFPGVIGVSVIDKPVDFTKGFDYNTALLYFYGTTTLNDSIRHAKLCEIMAKKLKEKCEGVATVVIAPNDPDEAIKICELFKIKKIVVVGDERLFHVLKFEGEKEFVRCQEVLNKTTTQKVHEYFYGVSNELTPFSLNLRDQKIFSKKQILLAPETALPLGSVPKIKSEGVEEVEFCNNYVVAILDASDEEEILTAPAIGFLITMDKDSKRVLAPQSRLPKEKMLLKGEIRYFEN